MHEPFLVGHSLCNNFFYIKNQNYDSRKHLLHFFPTAPPIRFFFRRFNCAGSLFLEIANSNPLKKIMVFPKSETCESVCLSHKKCHATLQNN